MSRTRIDIVPPVVVEIGADTCVVQCANIFPLSLYSISNYVVPCVDALYERILALAKRSHTSIFGDTNSKAMEWTGALKHETWG